MIVIFVKVQMEKKCRWKECDEKTVGDNYSNGSTVLIVFLAFRK